MMEAMDPAISSTSMPATMRDPVVIAAPPPYPS
jgi:hypothetical protein